MKKITALTLLCILLISLFGCGEKYPPVESTAEESETVMRLSHNGKSFDVRYELYRALYLANMRTVDGGDKSLWESEKKDELHEKLDAIVRERIADIYSVFYIADEIGEDVYSKEYEDAIDEYIRISIEGEGTVEGHGSYENYLDSLSENYMNYSVGVLMMRYSLALDKIDLYYYGKEDETLGEKGHLEFTAEDVEAFYYGTDSVRVLRAFIQEGVRTPGEIEVLRNGLMLCDTELSAALYVIGNTSITASEVLDGQKAVGSVIGRHALDSVYFSEYTRIALETEVGEVSPIVVIDGASDGYSDGYYIFYGLGKTEEHFERCYAEIEAAYKSEAIGKIIDDVRRELLEGITLTEKGESLKHDNIRMDN